MKVIGWGSLAQEIQERYQVGDRVLIEGRLTINTVERPEGFKEKQAELTAQKLHRISDLSSLDMPKPAVIAATDNPLPASPSVPASAPAAVPATVPPTAEAEVDYDDIPF